MRTIKAQEILEDSPSPDMGVEEIIEDLKLLLYDFEEYSSFRQKLENLAEEAVNEVVSFLMEVDENAATSSPEDIGDGGLRRLYDALAKMAQDDVDFFNALAKSVMEDFIPTAQSMFSRGVVGYPKTDEDNS